MEEQISKLNIERLGISNDAISILKKNNIKNIGQLCKKSKADLKNINVLQSDIKKAEIELELLGLNFKDSL